MRYARIPSSQVFNRWAKESAVLLQLGRYQFGIRMGSQSHFSKRKEIRIHAGLIEHILIWGDR